MTMEPIKVLVFDFDGVITKRGEALKEEAWEILAEKHLEPEEKTRAKDFSIALANSRRTFGQGKAKGSRYDILRLTLREVSTPEGVVRRKVASYADRYNRIVQRLILAEGMREGTGEVLEQLAARVPLYLNSATPTGAVEESLRRLNIRHLFQGVFGQPSSKVENLHAIMDREHVAASGIVFVGDTTGDVEAAAVVGCQFVGFANDWNKWNNQQSFPVVHTFLELITLFRLPT